jgi:hypothetical protein
MGRMTCTEPQCLYSRAIPLLPLWAVRPVQSLSACTVEHHKHTACSEQLWVMSKGKHRLSSDFLRSNMGKLGLMAVCIHTVLTEPAQIKTDKIHVANIDQWSIILEFNKINNKLMQLLIVFIPYLFIYSLQDMFRTTSAHHQEFFSLLYMQPPVICASARPWHCLVVTTRQCHGRAEAQITEGCMYSREKNSWWWADVARNMSSK